MKDLVMYLLLITSKKLGWIELLVTFIKTRPHHWLNFFMSDKDKKDLFVRGVEAGANFLKGFEWGKYKDIRAK